MKFTLIILLTIPYLGYSQFWQGKANVVATGGLNMRVGPSPKSNKICTVPYLSQVEILETKNLRQDTLSKHFFYGQSHSYADYVHGNWLRVRYKNYEGYVFSGYLITLNDDYFKSEEINNFYGLNRIGSNCFDNVHRNRNIKWKGIYKSNNGYEIKNVTLSYYNDFEELTEFKTTTNDNKNLLWVIGSVDQTFVTGEIDGEYFDWTNNQILTADKDGKFRSNFPFFDLEQENNQVSIILKSGAKKQNIKAPLRLHWKGDLDNDGEDDYIMTYGDKGATTILYLSSQAEEDQIVKAVAHYFSGYCC